MNRIYKLIWNAREHAYVVTSELARKSGKVVGAKVLTVVGALALGANVAYAAEDLIISDKEKVNGEDTVFIGSVDDNPDNLIKVYRLEDGQNIRVELERKEATGSLFGLNDGTGETTVNIKGDVTSSGHEIFPSSDDDVLDDAVSIFNFERTTNLTVNQEESSTIKGKNDGIMAANNGTGFTEINIAGTIAASTAVYANNSEKTQGVAIKQFAASKIEGSVNGIEVNNRGKGATDIDIAGNVSSTGNATLPEDPENPDSERYNSGSGIIAMNYQDSADLNITQSSATSEIRGRAAGIIASNLGAGSTKISTAGTVIADGEANNGIGIAVSNTKTAKAIHINQLSGNIKGKEKGISASNFGQGNTEITTAGDITGTSDIGIDALNQNFNLNNTETKAENKVKTDISVKQTAGSIIGGTDGIRGVNATGGIVSVNTAGKVEGQTGAGIRVVSGIAFPVPDQNGDGTGSAFTLNKKAATKAGDENGQTSLGGVNIVQQSDGEIKGFDRGIDASNYESGATNIQVSGTVEATGTARLESDKPETEYGTGIGILALNEGNTTDININQLTKSSKIQGKAGGISAINFGTGSTIITTEGTVIANGPGEYGSGISVYNGETANAITITQNTGEIEGDQNGILATNVGKGSTEITTAANVTGTKSAGIQANNINWNDTGAKTDIKVDQTAGNITGYTNGITAVNATGGNITVGIAGKVTGGSGAGIETSITSGNVSTTTEKSAGISNITLNRGADVSAVSGVAIIDGDNNTNVIVNGGAKVAGKIDLGGGDNTLTIHNGSDISGVTVLDGGKSNSNSNSLILGTDLSGSSAEYSNGNASITNWNNITLQESAKLTLTGKLDTDVLTIESGSELELPDTPTEDGYEVTGRVINSGSINMQNKHVGDLLTIKGSYEGKEGSKLLMDVTPEQNHDRLQIEGDAIGKTAIHLQEVSGLGNNTAGTEGISLITVGGGGDATTSSDDSGSASSVFTLINEHADAGAYEYRLQRQGGSWRLISEKKQDTGNKIKPKTAYRKEVPLLSAVGAQLRQADSLMLADMHKRIGATPAPDERKAWGRVIANRSDIRQNGVANVRSKGNYAGLQLGSDVWTDNGLRVGGYLGYLHGNLDVDGFASGVDGKVGKNSTKSYFLGAYGNYTRDSGTYLDVVLQGARHNADIKPNGASNSKQKGHGITASVEVGQPFALGSSSWKFEPQAQIMHQWLDLNDIGISGNTKVKQDHNNAWLFRLGGRLEGNYPVNKGLLRPYARLNFFYSPNGADNSTFATKAASTTLSTGASHANTEMAIGGSYEITDKVKAYGEIGHTWSDGNDAHVKSPVNGSVGLKVNW